jgi:hypothetical protein
MITTDGFACKVKSNGLPRFPTDVSLESSNLDVVPKFV